MKASRRIKSQRSASSSHIRSIPNAYRSAYIDLFILQKEKEKLVQETDRIKERLKKNLTRLQEIEDETANIGKRDGESGKQSAGKSRQERSISSLAPRRSWETMKVVY